MSVNFDEGLWAVVQVGGGQQKLIGVVPSISAPTVQPVSLVAGDLSLTDELDCSLLFKIEQAIGFFEQNIPIPLPEGRGIAFQRLTRGVPVDACLGPTTVRVRATSVHLFRDMNDTDRKRHQELYMTCIRECEAEKARQSPIISPGPRRD